MLFRSQKARKIEPEQMQAHKLTPDVTTLVMRKLKSPDDLIRLSSTSKAIRSCIWPCVISRPSFALNSMALTFLKEVKQYMSRTKSQQTDVIHEKIKLIAFNGAGPETAVLQEIAHTVWLARKDNHDHKLLKIEFREGKRSLWLTFEPDTRPQTYEVFPETGHIEPYDECIYMEYNPPHLLAKLIELKHL